MDRVAVRLSYDGADTEAGLKRLGDTAEQQVGRVRVAIGTVLPQAATAANAATATLGQASDKLSTSLARQEQVLSSVTARLSPLAAAVRQAQKDYDNLNTIVAANTAKSVEAATLLPQAQERVIAAQKKLTDGANDNTKAFALNRTGLLELQAAGINSFQALAAGMGVARVATMEGAQVIGAFAQGGLGVTGILQKLVSPLGLATLGVAGLGAAFAVAVGHAITAQTQLREFRVTLQGMGSDSLASANDLQIMVRQLRDTGTSTAEAVAAVQSVLRAGLNPQAAGQIATAGRDLGAVTGTDGVQQLVAALKGGLEPTIALGLEFRKLSVAEVDNYREMARHGEAAAALDDAFRKIKERLSGDFEASLSDSQRAVIAMRGAWGDALDKLANTAPIQAAIKALTDLANLVKWLEDHAHSPAAAAVGGAVTGMAAGAAAGSIIPGVGTAAGAVVGGAVGLAGGAYYGAQTERSPYAAAAPIAGAGGTSAADIAAGFLGLGANNSQLRSFIEQTSHLDPATQAWCAAFANAVLAREGIAGTGSNVATSFLDPKFGSPIEPQDVARGDVIVLPNGLPQGETGGHVGFATGNTRLTDAGMLLEMISGNHRNAVGTSFVNANDVAIRRPGAAGAGTVSVTGGLNDNTRQAEVDKETAAYQRQQEILDKTGGELRIAQAAQEATTRAAQEQLNPLQTAQLVTAATGLERAKISAELNNAIRLTELEITNSNLIAAGYAKSAQSGQEASLFAKATLEIYQATGDVQNHRVQIEQRYAQLLLEETANERVRNAQDIQAQKDQQAAISLEIGLQGQSRDVITAQLALLKAKQEIDEKFPELSQKEKDARLATVAATIQLNEQLAQAQRNQQRIDDAFRSIADTINGTLTDAIAALFDPSKATKWATTVKSLLGSIVSQVASAAFIKPLLGSVAGALGLGNVAQQFGSLGGILGGSSGGSGSGGGLDLGTVSNGFSIFKSLGLGGGDDGLFSGAGNFLSGLFGHGPVASDFAAGSGPVLNVPGSLFNGSFGSVFGGIGAGFGAGSLLNSLIGGNSLFGSIGSGIGSIAGSFLGPLGGLAGGALGGLLGGLFGNNRPPNNESAVNLDPSGRLSGQASHGVGANDQTVGQIEQGIASILAAAKSIPGANLDGLGTVNIQAGTRDGIKLGYGGQTYNFASAQDAIKAAADVIENSITGISDTLHTVISHLSDPSQVQGAVQFAAIYDNLKSQADNAFSSVEKDVATLGPFATALDNLKASFDGLKSQAEGFGLALDPINKALAEAASRLQGDFKRSLDEAFNSASGQDFLNQLAAVGQQKSTNIADANAIGLGEDQATLDRIGKIASDSANSILKQLTAAQLASVVDALKTTEPDFSQLAQSLLDAGQAADQLAASTQASNDILAAGIRIRQYLNQLDATGGSPETNLAGAQSQYAAQLKLAQGGDVSALQSITSTASTLIQAVQAYYASSAPGAQIIAGIKQDLAALPGVPDALTGVANKIVQVVTDTGDTIKIAVIQGAGSIVDQAVANTRDIVTASVGGMGSIIAAATGNAADIRATIADVDQTGTAALLQDNRNNAAALVNANGQAAGELIAANNNSSAGIIAANNDTSARLVAANNDSSTRIVAANDASIARLSYGLDASGVAMVTATLTGANSIVAANSNDANSIVTATLTGANAIVTANNGEANSIVAAILAAADSSVSAAFATASVIIAELNRDISWLRDQLVTSWQTGQSGNDILATLRSMQADLHNMREYLQFLTEGSNAFFNFEVQHAGATAQQFQDISDFLRRQAFAA